MPLPSAGRPSVHARLVVTLAGATPARTAITLPSFPFAGAASLFAGRGRGYGKVGGEGGARLAGLGSYTALRLSISKNKISHFPSNGGGGAVLCLARRTDGEGSGDGGDTEVAGDGGDTEGAGDGGDHHNPDKACSLTEGEGTEGAPAVLCLIQRADGEGEGAGGDMGDAGDGSEHDITEKACNLTKGTEGASDVLCLAPRADRKGDGAGGGTEGAGAAGDHQNADEACDLNRGKGTEGAPSGGGGDDETKFDPVRSLLRLMQQLGWTIVQGLVTLLVFLLASALTYNIAYPFVYARIRATILSYLSDEDIYAYAYTFIKRILMGQLRDPEMTKQIQSSIVRILRPSYPYDYLCGAFLFLCWRRFSRRR